MSQLTNYDKKLTPTRVKAKERGDVDLDRLLKHGAARILPATPQYADLSDLPRSRGEAADNILRTINSIPDINPEFVSGLLKLPPDQALHTLQSMRPPAPKRDEKNNAKPAGSAPLETPAKNPEPAK